MKKIAIIIYIISIALVGCEEESTLLVYDQKDNIYFNFEEGELDQDSSIFYTFAYNPEKATDTIFLPVKITGLRTNFERTITLEVVSDGTSAEEETHFALLESYNMPADSGETVLPVILYSSDPILKDTSLVLNIRLMESQDFGVELQTERSAQIVFSNRLEKPTWWDLWASQLGNYSRTKHQFYITAAGNEDLISDYGGDNYLQIPRCLFLIDQLRIFLNDPFNWVSLHSDEYVLDQESEDLYHFYSVSNPQSTYDLSRNQEDGKFYFQDENGQRVTMN